MPYCKSKKHFWLNPVCATYCCNGYKQRLRIKNEITPEEEARGGIVHVDGMPLGFVWYPEDEDPE